MRMFRKIGLLLPLGFLAFAGGTVRSRAQQRDSISVIPEPAHASRVRGTLDLHHGIGFDTSVADADAVGVARYLQGLLATTGNRGLMKFSSKTTQGFRNCGLHTALFMCPRPVAKTRVTRWRLEPTAL